MKTQGLRRSRNVQDIRRPSSSFVGQPAVPYKPQNAAAGSRMATQAGVDGVKKMADKLKAASRAKSEKKITDAINAEMKKRKKGK